MAGDDDPLTSTPGPDPSGLRPLLDEVAERVEGVAPLADRLQGLLHAVVSIGSHLELDEVLHQVVETVAEVADAAYAALGVLNPHGSQPRLSQFITVGIGDADRARIGNLPHGRGVLGMLIDDPRAIRLTDIAAHPTAAGFPPNHPPMRSFLGVPIRVRGEVFGNLYLTEKRGGGPFTADDERLVLALATAAGLAIANARLYEQAQLRKEWLEASSEITTRLLTGAPTSQVFPTVVARARELVAADTAFLALPTGDGTLSVAAADGYGADRLRGAVLPRESMSVRVIAEGHTAVVVDAPSDQRISQGVIESAGAGPALFVPLGTADDPVGTLVVTNRAGRPGFTAEATALVASFAGQAMLALRLGAAARDREQLAVLGDRDRIARDLHDLVIQRLFATGLSLESALRGMQPATSSDRVRRAVDDLDETIKEIRTSIFALQSPAPIPGEGLRAAILHVSRSAAATLGFEPHVVFDGPVDSAVEINVEEQLLAVLREALSNVTRHARASAVTVKVTASRDHVWLAVRDNGVGMAEGGRHSGLANLARRADDLGGTFHVRSQLQPESGTVLEWRVPLAGG